MSTEIEQKKAGALVSMADMAKYSGMGFENMSAKDVSIPFTAIIQKLSPQRDSRHAKFIKGANDGDIFNSVTGAFVPGDRGILVVPCAYQKKWVEWKDRNTGGGFVQQHDTEAVLAQTKKDPTTNKDMLPNGNLIVTTAYHYVIIVHEDGALERTVISFTSTNLKQSRKWNSIMQAKVIKDAGGSFKAPMFSHIYRLVPVMQSKSNMSWFIWDMNSGELIDKQELFNMGMKFCQDIMAGTVKAAAPEDETVVEDHASNETF